MRIAGKLAAGAVVAALALGAAVWMLQERAAAPPPVAVQPRQEAPAPRAPVAAAPPAVRYPLAPDVDPALTTEGIRPALAELLGRATVAALLLTDDFPRRVVATVDNLGREHAPAMLWPVSATPGRFTVSGAGDAVAAAPGNESRYAAFVRMADSIDVARAARLYRRMYPLLNTAYHELGYPRAEFNDRLVDVIDLLLATPDPAEALQLELLEVKGPVPSQRPWVHYQFADPGLQSLAAGQKILLRVGPANAKRLKVKLAQVRAAIVNAPAVR